MALFLCLLYLTLSVAIPIVLKIHASMVGWYYLPVEKSCGDRGMTLTLYCCHISDCEQCMYTAPILLYVVTNNKKVKLKQFTPVGTIICQEYHYLLVTLKPASVKSSTLLMRQLPTQLK